MVVKSFPFFDFNTWDQESYENFLKSIKERILTEFEINHNLLSYTFNPILAISLCCEQLKHFSKEYKEIIIEVEKSLNEIQYQFIDQVDDDKLIPLFLDTDYKD